MARGRQLSPEQAVVRLRQIEVQLAQGMSLAQACKEIGISEQNSGTSASRERSSPVSRRLES
jgi:transposase